jgi:pyruvate-formate lyase-activating enzyme
MIIRYKMMEHERFEDAPFIGCLISAIDCHINCKNCFNQHLKTYPTLTKDSKSIIEEIKSNPFENGIILGGLEWTEQPEEMLDLIESALNENLKVILYTGLSE